VDLISGNQGASGENSAGRGAKSCLDRPAGCAGNIDQIKEIIDKMRFFWYF
jgi:hypothetical protein